MLTIFKAASGSFSDQNLVTADTDLQSTRDYIFILAYMVICFILIMNLIVGQLASAYSRYVKKKNVLMLLETLSVREASQADEKYSAAVSCPYPLSLLNLVIGTYVLSVKNPKHNVAMLHLYYLPTMLTTMVIFIAYQFLVLPFAYAKIVIHKCALILKNPQGAGAKTTADRFGYALFFLVFGVLILLIDCLVDIFWCLGHLYKMDLDEVA